MPYLAKDEHVYRSYMAVFKNVPLWRGWKRLRYRMMVSSVLSAEKSLEGKSDDELKQLAQKYREEAANGRSVDSLLVPYFALVRQVSTRVLGLRHYPVQILGGIALHKGHIVEMATGEGKTLAAVMPAALNALTDRGVHVVTVNDYLAKRDSEQMGKIYNFLGLSTGVITHEKSAADRTLAYRANITYGTNKEFGFDFLRDDLRNRKTSWWEHGRRLDDLRVQQVQRPDFHFAIVDEADSVLIDEARTPLIIADSPNADPDTVHEFHTAHEIALNLREDVDYSFDRAKKSVEWLRQGEQRITSLLGGKRSLSGHRIDWHESCLRAIKANRVFHKDVDYVIDNDEVVIVDENTGRKMPGRHWEEGLHQAVTAKEKLPIKGQNETLARTTYQVFFNRYEKLSGMTGTAMTDAVEFAAVYRIGAMKIPTNRPCIRERYPDLVFGSEAAKWDAVVKEIGQMVAQQRAVLVGTRSIDKSELISELLTANGIPHVVLNARHEEKEAGIVAQAGQPGKVTVSTNMAGRGTDILLHKDVASAGGLHVIGTERHESRRVDNQLVGRCARQGDPGSCRYILSVEDPLIHRFRKSKAERLIRRYAGRTKPIPGPFIKSFFSRVQKAIERQHRKTRYELIKYDRERIKYNQQLGTQ